MKGLILGAGFTGLAAGIKTGLPIYEASEQAGGICTSYFRDGFEFSHGGPHFLFGKGVGLDYIKSLVPVAEHERRAGIYYNHTFPYPIQTVAQKPIVATPGSLKEWFSKKFSVAECNLFFNPQNEKYTAGFYDEIIQCDEFKSPPAGSVGFVSTFCDPVGGLTPLVKKMAEKCTIQYKKAACKIDVEHKAVAFTDGTAERYDKLISTIPLGQLLAMCGYPLREIQLPYNSVLVLNIGAEPDVCTPKEHWLYVPFCKTNFYRLSFYSNVDTAKAPPGKVGMAVEMAFSPEFDYEDLDVPFIIREVVSELQSWRMIGPTITVDPTWVKTAYTWLHAKETRDNHLAWLKERDIISTGRYGKWHFQGMVDSIKDGFEVSL